MTEYMEYSKIRNTRNKPIIQNTKTRNLQNILKQDMEYTEYYLTQNKEIIFQKGLIHQYTFDSHNSNSRY